MVIIIKQAGR